MAQKFIGLDDAAEMLGVSKDRLNELRDAGKLRAYRDGTSWRYPSDEKTRMA
jgi:excisionase family DNA binding protein